jgi:hypothetical protein
MLEIDSHLLASHPGQKIMGDKGYASSEFEAFLADHGASLIRPARSDDKARTSSRFLRPLRQLIESVNDTLKGQLDLVTTVAEPMKACLHGSSNGCWCSQRPSEPSEPSGTTLTAVRRPCGP